MTNKLSVSEVRAEVRNVGIFAAAVAFFFTQGLPLWNEDYSQWLAQANAGFFDIFLRMISPFTQEPQAWGYSDRPAQVLLYKVFHIVFGTWGTGYYLMKAAAFGLLATVLYRWMRELGVKRNAAYAALAVFVLSVNTQAALIWHSDFSVYSQLALVWILHRAFREIESGSVPKWSDVFTGKAPRFARFALIFFATVYFGTKIRGDMRLAPMAVLAYVFLMRRERLATFGPLAAGAFLATLPWSAQMFQHLPPFLPGNAGAYSGWTYGQFSLARVFQFLAGDILQLNFASISLLGGMGLLTTVAMLAYFGVKLYQERLPTVDRPAAFLLYWLGCAVVACGMIPIVANRTFELHYTFILLVPATLLLGRFFQVALTELDRMKAYSWLKHVATAAVVLQCGLHAWAAVGHRLDMGRTTVAIDHLYSSVDQNFRDSKFLLGPGFLSYGYKADASTAIVGRRGVGSWDEVAQFPAQSTLVASWGSTLDARFSVETVASACGSAVFDRVFSCQPTDGIVLLRYVGMPAELVQAEQLQKGGNLPAARQTLAAYLTRVPGNHGATFVKSTYDERAGDFAQMEQAYDRIGPFFPGHSSVVYNWGLAKKGVQKFAEASVLLEKAYTMFPKNYGVGFNLAAAYFSDGKKSRALATVGELMKEYPDNAALKTAYEQWKNGGAR